MLKQRKASTIALTKDQYISVEFSPHQGSSQDISSTKLCWLMAAKIYYGS